MEHDLTPAASAVLTHVQVYFNGAAVTVHAPAPGPIHTLVPAMQVLSVAPDIGRRIYVTAGLAEATQTAGHGLEFILGAPSGDVDVHIETITMAAYYHAAGDSYTLGLGHTVPIGRPWLQGSSCDHLLVSLPYPWGPALELCPLPDGHAQLLWLLPITAAEKRFRHDHDLEALESLLEEARIYPTDPHRPSVV